jgi:hypothetical protein
MRLKFNNRNPFMSTRAKQFNRYFLFALVGTSTWLAACSVSYDMSSLSGGRQHDQAVEIIREISEIDPISPACQALATSLVEAGLKARVAHWMPTVERLIAGEEEAARRYELGSCPIRTLPSITFAIASHGNALERERMKLRVERW